MPMTVIVTRDVAARFRGFLSSVMLEIAPGVYTSPNMTRGVRQRVWTVLADWYGQLGGGAIVMTYRDLEAPGRQAVVSLGEPPRVLVEADGMLLVKQESPAV